MFIVCYHYILDPEIASYALHGPTIGEFEIQLDILRDNCFFRDIKSISKKSNTTDKRSVAISFDDGMVEHYTILPLLQERSIRGSFFPIGCVFEGIVPITIKMHVILSLTDGEVIVEKLEQYMREHFSSQYPNYSIPRDYRVDPLKGPYDDIATANLKSVLAELPLEVKEDFVNEEFKLYVNEYEKKFCESFFMKPKHLKEMHEAGMVIGTHGFHHTSLKAMNYEEQKKEISKSKKIIEDIIGAPIDCFSYPFGYYNHQTRYVLKELGFKHGVLFNHEPLKTQNDPLLLSEYDYKDINWEHFSHAEENVMGFGKKWAGIKKKNVQSDEYSLFVSPGNTPVTQRQLNLYYCFILIKDILTKNNASKILEVGCGRGTLSLYLAKYLNMTTWLLDNEKDAIELAQQAFRDQGLAAHFMVGDVLAMNHSDNSFDAVVSIGLAEHFTSLDPLYGEQFRVLRPGGVVVSFNIPKKFSVQILNVAMRVVKKMIGSYSDPIGKDYYRNSFSAGEYADAASRAGFKKISIIHASPFPLYTPISLTWDKRITKVNKLVLNIKSIFQKYPYKANRLTAQAHFLIAYK